MKKPSLFIAIVVIICATAHRANAQEFLEGKGRIRTVRDSSYSVQRIQFWNATKDTLLKEVSIKETSEITKINIPVDYWSYPYAHYDISNVDTDTLLKQFLIKPEKYDTREIPIILRSMKASMSVFEPYSDNYIIAHDDFFLDMKGNGIGIYNILRVYDSLGQHMFSYHSPDDVLNASVTSDGQYLVLICGDALDDIAYTLFPGRMVKIVHIPTGNETIFDKINKARPNGAMAVGTNIIMEGDIEGSIEYAVYVKDTQKWHTRTISRTGACLLSIDNHGGIYADNTKDKFSQNWKPIALKEL